ncbi:hypothetical protein TorRG33x02_226440 [Trema orientale]|uniref:Uncharacterized protein n=1 Tax=Trema orientale TaxID=63057 RepID=A0A2P5E7V5_TREOI|nr:hypothetical protein TorRG33x02_226440 [Trema orientale]
MEPIDSLSVRTNNNRENVTPSSQNHNCPFLSRAQFSKKIKKRRLERKPLADISHLFNNNESLAQSRSSPDLVSILINLGSDHISRTKKAPPGLTGHAQVTSSKSLRMGFR